MVLLRKTVPADRELLFEWANDPDTRSMSINGKPITWENHIAWFDRKLLDENTKMFILSDEETNIGQVRFEWKDCEWLIGYSIAKKFRGRGLGKQILLAGIAQIEKGKITGYVKPANLASVKIFTDLGFAEEEISEQNGVTLIKFSLVKS
jgi:RimJ/RimL family protein N-acetyltransferase